MANYRRLWITLILIVGVTFSILGYYGYEIYRKAPPIPQQVVTVDGELLMTKDSILNGQTAWQSVGGMQLGSIWGHGAYQAPDWTADWLHRELIAWLELAAVDVFGKSYDALDGAQQHSLQYDLKADTRRNRYDSATDTLVVSDRRAQAISQAAAYCARLVSADPELRSTRVSYAM